MHKRDGIILTAEVTNRANLNNPSFFVLVFFYVCDLSLCLSGSRTLSPLPSKSRRYSG